MTFTGLKFEVNLRSLCLSKILNHRCACVCSAV